MGTMWLTNFAVTYFIPPAFENIKWKTYLIFGVTNFAMAVHVFLAFPETASKTLEEVETIFASKVPAWKTKTDRKKVVAWEHGNVDPEQVVDEFRRNSIVRQNSVMEQKSEATKERVEEIENVSH